jgi:hypothetical protein
VGIAIFLIIAKGDKAAGAGLVAEAFVFGALEVRGIESRSRKLSSKIKHVLKPGLLESQKCPPLPRRTATSSGISIVIFVRCGVELSLAI